MERKILSVSNLTTLLKRHIEDSFYDIWITGEITDLNVNKNNHCFFTLKDENAVISCVIWRNHYSNVKFKLENGLKIIANGNISLYEKGGRYNFTIYYLEPEGLGDLMRQFLILKEQLEKAGYFSSERKKEIPPFPDTVGVITSPTGAALKDILKVMKTRFSNVNVVVYPTKVQGDAAAKEIAEMIKVANKIKQVDVLIIGRGGGSYEDLWAFNEKIVADAIYESEIPIISAVGHQIDYTIADFVADLRAPTPSTAAEIVVGSKKELKNSINSLSSRLNLLISSMVEKYREKVIRLSEEQFSKKILNFLEKYKYRLADLESKSDNFIKNIYVKRKNAFLLLAEKLEILNPLAILSRGYSIVYKTNGDKEIVKSTKQLNINDKIKIKLYEGISYCRVEEKND